MIVKTILAYFGLAALPAIRDDRVHAARNREANAFAAHQLTVSHSLKASAGMIADDGKSAALLDRLIASGNSLRALADETLDRTRQ